MLSKSLRTNVRLYSSGREFVVHDAREAKLPQKADAVVVGGGHNGLTAVKVSTKSILKH